MSASRSKQLRSTTFIHSSIKVYDHWTAWRPPTCGRALLAPTSVWPDVPLPLGMASCSRCHHSEELIHDLNSKARQLAQRTADARSSYYRPPLPPPLPLPPPPPAAAACSGSSSTSTRASSPTARTLAVRGAQASPRRALTAAAVAPQTRWKHPTAPASCRYRLGGQGGGVANRSGVLAAWRHLHLSAPMELARQPTSAAQTAAN